MMTLLQDLVAIQAETRPHASAIVGKDDRVTYGELHTRSNQLARLLKDAGCRRGDRVAVLMPKSPMAIVAILGIYKADCIFVPLDPASPAPRLARVLSSSEPRCLLAGGPVADLVQQVIDSGALPVSTPIGWFGPIVVAGQRFAPWFVQSDLRSYAITAPARQNTDRDPAHLLFTSGSTGTPKGVIITHANVMRFVEWACCYFGMSTSDRVSGHSPLHFDLSTFDIFGSFAAGAELHLVPSELNVMPHKLAEFIRSRELTQWFSVPSILNYLAKFDAIQPHDFPTLKRLLWCGEVLPTPALMYFMDKLPHVTFTNLYGPTEATIASGYYTVKRRPESPSAEIPIGIGCDGEELVVLDDSLQPVRPGEIGNLYISGVGLSPGYWRDAERTAAVFVTDPRRPSDRLYKTGDLARMDADGLVYFLGRADTQIKSRGYRIELGEIEAALSTIQDLQEAAVLGIPSEGFEGTLIACAYAPMSGRTVSPSDLRQALGTLVPPYMLPSRWVALPTLPKNASGKIDRRALRDHFHAHDARTA